MENAPAAEQKKGKRYRSRYASVDFPALLVVMLLVVFGVIMVFSASYYTSISESGDPYEYLKSDALYAGIGFVLMIGLIFIDYHVFFRLGPVLLVLALGLMIFLIVPGNPFAQTINQATRWIAIPGVPFTIMPGEIAKACMIFFMAWYLSKNPKSVKKLFGIAIPGVIALGFLLLYAKQPNLSTGITFCLITFVMMLVTGLHWGFLALPVGAIAAGYIIMPIMLPDHYWTKRIIRFTDPFADPLDTGWQAVESIYAMSSGGFFGTGLGNSVIKALYLPEPMNDYILAIIGEELGFAGCFALLAAFLFLIWRCCRIAIKAPDTYGMLLATGVTAMLAFQVLMNVAVVTSSMPATGVSLPFISYGGNALIIFMALMGIMMNISKQSVRTETEDET